MGERPLRTLGKSYPREDGPEMVAGLSQFVEDLRRPGMLYGAVVRAGRPHARILGVDAGRAAKAPGVACVLTAADVPVNSYGMVLTDQPVLCGDKVRYEGDPVVALCATSWEAAGEAARLVRVRYEDLPAVTDPVEALRPGSPLVHESHPTGNLVFEGSVIRGDIAKGFAEAEVIVEARYRTGPQEHAAIEPHLTLAEVDPAGRLNVHVSSQTPFRIQADLARVLKLPLSRVRVISCVSGGAFGGKHEIMLESLASLCAIKTRRPVTFRMSREEEFTVSAIRHSFTMDYKTGLTREGKITAAQVVCLLDGGAYCAAGNGVGAKGALMAPGPYVIPNVRSDFKLTYTNNGFAGAVRGFGATQTTFACERHMDHIARRLGIEPMELRRRNAMKTGDAAHSGDPITSCGLGETMDRAADAIRWSGIGRGRRSGRYRRGRGMAAMIYPVAGFGQATPAAAFARVNADATLTVITGIVDVGQGANVILRQLAAEELGIPLEHVHLINGDTAISPFDPGSTGSRVAHVGGLGVKKAVAQVKAKLLARAAAALEAAPEDLEIADGEVFVASAPERKKRLAEIAQAAYKSGDLILGEATHRSGDIGVNKANHQGKAFECYVFATQCAEVEVDTETGEYRVLRLVAAHDVGRAINPMNVEGQIEGGASMGFGLGTTEVIQMAGGRVLNPDFRDYLIPTSVDMPGGFTSLIVETLEPRGPFGVKGVAEPSVNPTAPAVVNAICDAIGVEINDLPATPEAVFRAIRGAGDGHGRS
ncbi:MAG: xanthine dehydrogenase family protein molybdopterin-binding subunit [Nitrospinota bacterium]